MVAPTMYEDQEAQTLSKTSNIRDHHSTTKSNAEHERKQKDGERCKRCKKGTMGPLRRDGTYTPTPRVSKQRCATCMVSRPMHASRRSARDTSYTTQNMNSGDMVGVRSQRLTGLGDGDFHWGRGCFYCTFWNTAI